MSHHASEQSRNKQENQDESQEKKSRSESLYQIKGLRKKLTALEARVQSARRLLPGPLDTPPKSEPVEQEGRGQIFQFENETSISASAKFFDAIEEDRSNQARRKASLSPPSQYLSSRSGERGSPVGPLSDPDHIDSDISDTSPESSSEILPDSSEVVEEQSSDHHEMARIILSVNAGSSSVKVSVYKDEGSGKAPKELAVVQVDGLTAPPPTLKYDRGDEHVKGQKIDGVSSQEDGFKAIMKHLEDDEGLPELSNRDDVAFVTHRVVHGGDYPRAQVLTKETYHHIEELSDLAPLHNGPALTIVKAAHAELPKAVNVAYFDSAFHATIPKHISTYPIDQTIAKKNGLRKYGFHGLSYSFILKAVAQFLGKKAEDTSIIALHLGSGASACAIKKGESWDTSMGLTPLAGLPGATRSGSVDPSLVFHYAADAGKMTRKGNSDLHISKAEEILNKEAGWKAIAGTTDFGKISAGEDEASELAFDLVVDRILGYVGSHYVSLKGEVDALVFAGGIGEKGSKLRAKVVEGAACLGFAIDGSKNEKPEDEVVTEITAEGAKHKVLICQTDEQLEMARDCVERADEFQKEAKEAVGMDN